MTERLGRIGTALIAGVIALEGCGGSSASPTGTQADHLNPDIASGMQSREGMLASQDKTVETIGNIECTTYPILPYQPKINNLGVQAEFTNTDTVPCLKINYSDGSAKIIVSPFSAYVHPRKGPDGTYLFPKLCNLPGIAEPIDGSADAILVSKNDLGLPSYCVYPPVEKGKSNYKLIPLAQQPNQTTKQPHSV